MQGRKGYQEKLFTSFRLSDRVPEDNFYRRLNASLDLRFLYKTTKKYYGKEGQSSIDPVVFFKLLLTGYFENLQSDRRIIENARLRMDILYFIGYDIDEDLPWHSTLSRTRQLYGEEIFQALFLQVLKLCIDKGMVSGRRQAIDSVLVKANASMDSVIKKDADEYIASLDDAAKEEGSAGEKRPPASGKPLNKTHYSPTDPDARIATKPGKPSQLNYLGQVSVDTAHHVITNIEAHHADKRDSECLEQVMGHTIDNLSSHGLEVKEIIADTNYSSAEALKAADKKKVDTYIPNHGGYKTIREGFTYDAQGDYYQCTRGIKLPFTGIKITHDKTQMRRYRSSKTDCGACPLKTKCAGKSGYKVITHSLDKPLFDEMNRRLQSKYARRLMKLRQSTVEPVIGTLVHYTSMRKMRTIGIPLATKSMLTAAIAYNLKKWLKWKTMKRIVKAIALPIPEINTLQDTWGALSNNRRIIKIAVR